MTAKILIAVLFTFAVTDAHAQSTSSSNQKGGVTAGSVGTINIYGEGQQTAWHIVQQNPTTSNSDRTYTRTYRVQTETKTAQNNVVFMVRGKSVIDITVNGVGSGPAIRAGRGVTEDGWHWDAFSLPTVGVWNVGATTRDAEGPFELNVVFNATIN